MTALKDAQLRMARFLRDPDPQELPEALEPRRLDVYRELVYRNIEGFISSAFPVLRRLYGDDEWEAMVRDFIRTHRCATPLFLQISEEFLAYLSAKSVDRERPFAAELAHYEWLELAVDVAPGDVPELSEGAIDESMHLFLSPAAQLASYRFPVHRIGPSFQPVTADEGTFLLVYRDRDQAVQFMELSAGAARLLHEITADADEPLAQTFARLAQEWQMELSVLTGFALEQISDFHQRGVLGLSSTPSAASKAS